jgi:pimeloyl-ACP methyl ester carboxylesterase
MKHGFKALMAADRSLPAKRTARLAEGSVEYLTAGDGQPAIILLDGFGMPLTGWALVFPELAKTSTVFTCDLVGAGVGGGPAAEGPQAGRGCGTASIDQLRGALAAAGVQPPYVLVGHALGALYANLYARLFPRELAGLVLLEPAHPNDDVLERHVRFFPRAVTRVLMARTLAAQQRLITETAREIERSGPFPDLPLTVISGGRAPSRLTTSTKQVAIHATRQQQLAALSATAKHIVAPNSEHWPQITDPAIVVQAVREIVASTSGPWVGDTERPHRPGPAAWSNPGPTAGGMAGIVSLKPQSAGALRSPLLQQQPGSVPR